MIDDDLRDYRAGRITEPEFVRRFARFALDHPDEIVGVALGLDQRVLAWFLMSSRKDLRRASEGGRRRGCGS